MSDRFLLKSYCLDCGTNLYPEKENIMPPMMAVGETLDLKCPACKTMWRFWIGVKTYQKKLKNK